MPRGHLSFGAGWLNSKSLQSHGEQADTIRVILCGCVFEGEKEIPAALRWPDNLIVDLQYFPHEGKIKKSPEHAIKLE